MTMGKQSVVKGKRVEREVAKKLTEFLGIKFFRTPQSGASPISRDYKVAGDICTNEQNWQFCIEVKSKKTWHLESIFSKTSKFWQWWAQTIRQAHETNLKPLLIIKTNFAKFFAICLREDCLATEDVLHYFDGDAVLACCELETWCRAWREHGRRISESSDAGKSSGIISKTSSM